MASLSAHLRQAGDHGRLGFHADCPVCRQERLFGALSSESVVTRRARTALLTGVVAASLTTPPAVWGQEADTRQEGVAAPHEPSDGQGTGSLGELEDPEFDPGGETDLPSEVEVPHGTPPEGAYDEEGESGPLELEPEVDLEAPPIDPEAAPPATGDEDLDDPDAPSPGEPAPRPPETAPPPLAGEAPDPAPRRQSAGKPDSPRDPAAKQRSSHNDGDKDADVQRAASPPPVQAAPQAPAPVESAPSGEATQVAQSDPAPPPPSDGARVHVVQAGESLWVIANGALPPGASMARIAREVNRLWELNEGRIATGDPDLLRIGTELRLR